jgi:hypothetical protein
MNQHDELTYAVVLVVQIDVSGIFLTDSNVRHSDSSTNRVLKWPALSFHIELKVIGLF